MVNKQLLDVTKEYAAEYLRNLQEKPVFPSAVSLRKLDELLIPLPEGPKDPIEILDVLNRVGSANTVRSNGGRYFGFVFGGALPASLCANWLASAWDQNASFRISSPIAAQLERVTGSWLLELLDLPKESVVGFVTGTTMANFSGALAARYHLLNNAGWNVKSKGFNNAPSIRVVVGEEVHASMIRALMFAGFGIDQLYRVPTDEQGRIIPEEFPEIDERTFICLQAGNVNTGAIDPMKNICMQAKEKGAWVHIDGAFGLWARATPSKAALAEGCELADSWAVDLHKWLNVPYDCGLVVCKHAKVLHEALSVSAAYLPDSAEPEPFWSTPEMSRRARGIEPWAAIYSLGRKGVADLIERCCELAQYFASKLKAVGFEILNDVSLNQVLVSFGEAELTNRVIKKIQEDGTCWCGGTVWKGKTAMRISVSSWMTTRDDIEISAATIISIAKACQKEFAEAGARL